MASSGSGAQQGAVVNGSHSNGRNQTPADLVGNQFVSQFYTVLHSSPNYLYRFYTDSSTLTHADQGVDGDQPTTYTVTSQKGINDRVLAMGFEEAVTEIWSVDSQYSQNDGVLVMVTGSLQCKGKKKRDFVQSFFLAVQEKGYFVLNDVFRYLSDRSKPQYPKENGYAAQYDKSAYQAGGGYHSNYFPGQGAAPHHGPTAVYQSMHYPAPGALAQSAPQVVVPPQQRTAAVTPSGPPQAPPPRAPAVVPPKPLAPVPVSAPSATPPAPVASQQPPPPASVAPPPQQPAPVSAPQAVAPSQPAAEAPRAAAPSAPAPPAAIPPTQEPPKAAEVKPEAPAAQPKPAAPKAEAPKLEAPAKAAEPEEKQAPAVPAAPLSYADRLKMGAARAAARPAPSVKPSSAPPKPSTPTPAKEETAPEASASVEEPSTNLTNGDVGILAEEAPMTSIFVRELPADVTAEKIEAAFSRFGTIKGGLSGVNLKQQKGKDDFAFVEFEEAAAMQAAIEGSVFVGDQKVSVVERRPMFVRSGGRGGSFPRGRSGDRGGYRGGPSRSDRGRGGRGGYQGRGDGPGRGGEGRGRGGYSNGPGFSGGEGRGRGSERGGRGPPRDGPREGGRGPSRAPQSAPPARAQA